MTKSRETIAFPMAAAGLATALAVGVLLLMFTNAETLVTLGFTGYLWMVLLLLLGFSVSVAIFALFKSYARLSGRALSGHWEIGGPAVVMMSVVCLGFYYVPAPAERFDLTVFIVKEGDSTSLLLLEKAKLVLDLEDDRRTEAVGPKGEAHFAGIPANMRGKTVRVSLDNGFPYELSPSARTLELRRSAVYLPLRILTIPLLGQVFDAESKAGVEGATVASAAQSTQTAQHGHFELRVPADLERGEPLITISAPYFEPWQGRATLAGAPLRVSLERTKK